MKNLKLFLALAMIVSSCHAGLTDVLFLKSPERQISSAVLSISKLGREKSVNRFEKGLYWTWGADADGDDTRVLNQEKNWIFDVFEMTEADIKAVISSEVTNKFHQTVKLGEINRIFEAAKTKINDSPTKYSPQLFLVEGVSITDLANSKTFQNSIGQYASQANYKESKTDEDVDLLEYITDFTQGPMGVSCSVPSTLARIIAADNGLLPHMLNDVIDSRLLEKEIDGSLWENFDHQRFQATRIKPTYYRNGYLHLGRIPEEDAEKILTQVQSRIENLNICGQWAMDDRTGKTQFQVFSAAPSFQGRKSIFCPGVEKPTSAQRTPPRESVYEQICSIINPAQYGAIIKLAGIRSIELGDLVDVHLTLIGMGEFRNEILTLARSLETVLTESKELNIRIFIHVFNDIARKQVDEALALVNCEEKNNIKAISKDAFFNLE